MMSDIQEAINKNLPTQVGEQLKLRLTQAEQLEKQVASLTATVTRRDEEIARLEVFEVRVKACEAREREVAKAERALELEQAKLSVAKEHMQARLTDCKEIVLAVFANNKFKYTESGCTNQYGPQGTNNGSVSKTIETQG